MRQHVAVCARKGEAVSENLYEVGKRDIIGQQQHYTDHVWHMTSEGLHGKSDIAAELAHRDIEIERLTIECHKLAAEREQLIASNDAVLGFCIEERVELVVQRAALVAALQAMVDRTDAIWKHSTSEDPDSPLTRARDLLAKIKS
jgi:hypothetical protein